MTTLTAPPTAPDTNDPDTFDARADAYLAWIGTTNIPELNAFQAALTSIAAGTAFAIPYTFSTTTTDSDPGAGFLRLDNATQNTATTIRADLLGSDGSTWTDVLATFDDSTSTIKGQITLVKLGDATKWLAFNVTALASPSGYKNISVTNVASSAASPFVDTDTIALQFTRTGDKGDTAVFTGGSLTSGLNYSRATVASHATTADIWAATGNQIDWTGTATTTIFPNAPQAGAERVLICAGACSFTAGANMLIDGVASGNTVTCAANDQVIVRAVSTTQFKLSRIKYDGTAQVAGGVNSIVTATTATTLTSNPTLLQITPANYGVAVTLPDATTCSLGGPLHIIDNKGAYPVKVLNTSGTLLGFIFAGVVSHISLIDKSTAAGVWSIENNELVGASAQLLTTNLTQLSDRSGGCISLDSDREILIGCGVSGTTNYYAVVYNKATNLFGNVTLIRTCTGANNMIAAVLVGADKVLVVSTPQTSTAFEAVILSISGTTITVNTEATATLSANISSFADGCGLIQVGTSFITSYTVATPAAQIREITVSGTTPTISAATVLDGTAGGLIVAGDSTHVIAVSTATTHLYTKPYTIGGLSAGTGTDTNSGTMTLNKLAALGTRWIVCYNDGGSTVKGGVISLSGTTTTISAATVFSAGVISDAIIVSSSKVLITNNQTTNNANILTDTAGTASAGTAITLSNQTARACIYANGTNVLVMDGTATILVNKIDCSGSSPVLSKQFSGALTNSDMRNFAVSNSMLVRSSNSIYGSGFAQVCYTNAASVNYMGRVHNDEFSMIERKSFAYTGIILYRGKLDSERWVTDDATVITKVECVQ